MSEIRPDQVPQERALTIHRLVVPDCRLEQLFKFGLVLRCDKRQADVRNFGRGRLGGWLRRSSEAILE